MHLSNFRRYSRIPLALLYVLTFFLAGLQKISDPREAEEFILRFEETFLSVIPSLLPISFWGIATLEFLISFLAMLSLIRLEWQGEQKPVWLLRSIFLSLLLFLILGFGLRLSLDYQGAANAFFYFGFGWVFLQLSGDQDDA